METLNGGNRGRFELGITGGEQDKERREAVQCRNVPIQHIP